MMGCCDLDASGVIICQVPKRAALKLKIAMAHLIECWVSFQGHPPELR